MDFILKNNQSFLFLINKDLTRLFKKRRINNFDHWFSLEIKGVSFQRKKRKPSLLSVCD